jgi:hypothetical protein
MASILDIDNTLNGFDVQAHMLKLYEKAYDCILGVTIKFDEDQMPYFEIDDCRRGIVLFGVNKYNKKDICKEGTDILHDWLVFKAKPNKRRDEFGYKTYCKLYTGSYDEVKYIKFSDWDDVGYPHYKEFENCGLCIKNHCSHHFYIQLDKRIPSLKETEYFI